jgi:O-antigen ligase
MSAAASSPTVLGWGRRPELEWRRLAWLALLCCALAAEAFALTRSSLWAAPLLGLLVLVAAVDVPLIPFFGAALLVRVLTDGLGGPDSRHSSSLALSALIAALFILVAVGLLAHRRRGVFTASVVALAICGAVAVAVRADGLSTLTMREGIRELSILAVGVIAFNARRALGMSAATRLIQVAGSIAALLALYQLATHTGVPVGGDVRSNGTFAHPNDAAVFFAIATLVSLWRYTELGRRRWDLALTGLFAAAAISTFSIDGALTLLVMIAAFGLLRPGSGAVKLRAGALVLALALAFTLSPIGSARIASESSGPAAAGSARDARNSLQWRLYKWETLLPEWERSPYVGSGLGTTITAEATAQSTTAGNLPHSEYVRYLVETGVLGLLLVLAGVALLCARLGQLRGFGSARNAGALGLALVVGLLVNALAANTLLYTPAAYAAALVLGVALRERSEA